MRPFSLWLLFLIVALPGSIQHVEPASAEISQIQFDQLPSQVRDAIRKVREACKEQGSDISLDDMQGITAVSLTGDRSRHIVIENEGLCGGQMAGANCSNRGCDLAIWREMPGNRWRKVFDEHVHAKYLVIDWETMRLQMMVVSLSADDPRCKPNPRKQTTSGQSCNLIVTYKNNQWNWEIVR